MEEVWRRRFTASLKPTTDIFDSDTKKRYSGNKRLFVLSLFQSSFHHLSFTMSLNVTDPAISEAYEDVRDDKSSTNWAFFDFADGKPDRLKVAGKGSGGFSEFVQQLKPEIAGWGYVRMNMSNDE